MPNDATPNTEATVKTGSRPRLIDYSYRYRVDSDSAKEIGETGKKLNWDVTSVITKIIGEKDGEFDGEFEGELSAFFPDGHLPEPCMAIPTLAYGLKTTLGNAVQAPDVRNADPAKQIEAIETRYNTIVEDKEWREGRDGGPRLKFVVAAYQTYLENKHGKPFSERQLAALRAKVIKETTTEVLKNPNVRAEYDAAMLVEQQKKANESKAKAAQATVTVSDDEAEILSME